MSHTCELEKYWKDDEFSKHAIKSYIWHPNDIDEQGDTGAQYRRQQNKTNKNKYYLHISNVRKIYIQITLTLSAITFNHDRASMNESTTVIINIKGNILSSLSWCQHCLALFTSVDTCGLGQVLRDMDLQVFVAGVCWLFSLPPSSLSWRPLYHNILNNEDANANVHAVLCCLKMGSWDPWFLLCAVAFPTRMNEVPIVNADSNLLPNVSTGPKVSDVYNKQKCGPLMIFKIYIFFHF